MGVTQIEKQNKNNQVRGKNACFMLQCLKILVGPQKIFSKRV